MTHGRLGAFWSIRGMRILFLWQHLGTRTAPIRSGECIGRTTAARLGKKCCSRTTMSGRLIWRSTRKTRERFTRRFGIRAVRRGAFIRLRMARGAEYSNPRMAATTGNNFSADCRPSEWDGLELLSLRRIQIWFTPSWMRKKAVFIARTMRELRGTKLPAITEFGDAAGISAMWSWIPKIPRPCTFQTRRSIARLMAEKLGRRFEVRRAATIITSCGFIRTIRSGWCLPATKARSSPKTARQRWSSWYNQPTAQLYHVAADYRFPYWATGAQQDSGAVGVPERSGHTEISMHDWSGICAGDEAGYTAPDPLHPEILFGDNVTKCNVITGELRNVSPGAEPERTVS